jgi:hypothetical protein
MKLHPTAGPKIAHTALALWWSLVSSSATTPAPVASAAAMMASGNAARTVGRTGGTCVIGSSSMAREGEQRGGAPALCRSLHDGARRHQTPGARARQRQLRVADRALTQVVGRTRPSGAGTRKSRPRRPPRHWGRGCHARTTPHRKRFEQASPRLLGGH